jgi:hypothetical protein
VLIEHQSDTGPLMPLRTLFLVVAYWDRQWQQWSRLPREERPPFRLHPVLPIVLDTANTAWGSNRSIADLLGEPEAFHAFAPAWQPLFWNLSDTTPQALLDSGAEWLQTLAVIRAQDEGTASFQAVFEEALLRLEVVSGRDQVQWYDLVNIVLTWALWRRPPEERPALRAAAPATQANPVRKQEVQKVAQTIAESLIEEGRVEGEVQALRRVLRAMLEDAFTTLPDALGQQIDALNDPQRLQAAVRRVPGLKKLEDLRL